MSFASEIKNSLCRIGDCSPCCRTAELAAAICFAGSVLGSEIRIKTENESVAERIAALISEILGDEPVSYETAKKQGGIHTVTVAGEYSVQSLADALLLDSGGDMLVLCPNRGILRSTCCKNAFLRGAFLGGGSMSDPTKNYHAEFVTKTPPLADLLYELLIEENISAKMTVRKNSFVVYVKDSEAIANLIGLMGAGASMMDFYNIKIERELRNNVNRQVNCDSANVDKITAAAEKHLAAIRKIRSTIGFEKLPPTLGEIADLREQNPEMSLKELGTLLAPPIGKSGVNHRLERICEIAEDIK